MDEYDVVIVGGGAAGLSAGLALSRARRSVLVVDAGTPRNAPAGHVHNYLGREGTSPLDLLAAGREEVASYGGEVVTGTVASAQQLHGHDDGPGFRVVLGDGRAVLARRLLVTSGLVDELPPVTGVAQRWGRDVLHCPYCHGWEVRDQALGILASGPLAVHQALLFLQWSSDVTLFLHTAPAPTQDECEQLAARGIALVEGEVAAVEATDDRLTGVRLRSGQLVPCQAVVVQPRFTARVDVLATLGLEATEQEIDGHVIGSYIAADPTGATAVPGVWVAGNVADVRAHVIGAAAAGLNTAAAMNADLIAEETRQAVITHRQGGTAAPRGHNHGDVSAGDHESVFDEASWEERYRSHAAVWSGQPNPQLVAETTDLTPGAALDVGSGEGADALWLAARGWQVTAVDFSTTALQRGAERADALGTKVAGRTRWVHADLTEWAPAEGHFDLVSAQFMQLPAAPRQALFARLAAAVAPGGTLLIVGHHPWDLQTTMHRPQPGLFFTAEEIARALDPAQWHVDVAAARPRVASDPEGLKITIHDAVLRAHKRT